MRRDLITSAIAIIVLTVLLGLVYPFAMSGVSQVIFPGRANGSLVKVGGKVVGSALIGQNFADPGYFQPRPSVAGDAGYDASASSGSNLGPTSQKLRDRIVADVARLTEANPQALGAVPIELITTSASGLDPHLSPAAAHWQVPRVAHARGIAAERVRRIVEAQSEGRDLAFLGEARVNVLQLNLALDRQFGRPPGKR